MCAERHLTQGRGIKLKAAEQNFSAFTKDTSLYKCRPDIDAKRESRGLAPLPVGWRARSCPECGSIEGNVAKINSRRESLQLHFVMRPHRTGLRQTSPDLANHFPLTF
jgi:hypothetical protein